MASAPFFSGECQRLGITPYAPVYFALSPLATVLCLPFLNTLLSAVSPNLVQTFAIALLALASIPQGVANHLSPGGFIALTASLRLLDGVATLVAEVTLNSAILHYFDGPKLNIAFGCVQSLRMIAYATSPVLAARLYDELGGMAAPYVVLGAINIVTVLLASCCTTPAPPIGRPTASCCELLGIPALVAQICCITLTFIVPTALQTTLRARPRFVVSRALRFNLADDAPPCDACVPAQSCGSGWSPSTSLRRRSRS
jgi:hypothetical protein